MVIIRLLEPYPPRLYHNLLVSLGACLRANFRATRIAAPTLWRCTYLQEIVFEILQTFFLSPRSVNGAA